jgi:hypothetical protein
MEHVFSTVRSTCEESQSNHIADGVSILALRRRVFDAQVREFYRIATGW